MSKRSRYSDGSLFFRTPDFIPYDWTPAVMPGEPPLKPWDPMTPLMKSATSLTYVHETLGDGEQALEGHGCVIGFKSLFKLDVILHENMLELDSFQKTIQKWYSKAKPEVPLWNGMGLFGPYTPKHPQSLEPDLLVMMYDRGSFYRGCIVGPTLNEESTLKSESLLYDVEALDYGDVALVHRDNIYEMAALFSTYPVQALRCCLNLPYMYMHLERELLADPMVSLYNVDKFKEDILAVGLEALSEFLVGNTCFKIQYAWKDLSQAGDPWMVNLFQVEDDPKPSKGAVSFVTKKMDEKMKELIEGGDQGQEAMVVD